MEEPTPPPSSPPPEPPVPEPTPKENREKYFKDLEAWHRNYCNGMQQMAASVSLWHYMISQQAIQQAAAASSTNNYNLRILGQQRQEEIINLHGGFEYTIAPLWKRFIAEVIDVVILFLVKLMITFALVDMFDLNLNMDIDLFKTSIEDNYNEILNFTSELLILEIVTKILVCVYEAIWTQGYGQTLGGATPGKMLMGIRVLYVEAIVVLEGQQPAVQRNAVLNQQRPVKALLYPARNLGFQRALLRALAKNVFVTFLFPICFVIFLNRNNNRTVYEIITKTVVVEEPIRPPTLRRR